MGTSQYAETEQRPRLSQNILQSLRIIFRTIQAHARTVEKQCGLSSAQLWMMWEIYSHPGMKVSELAEALSIHTSTCSNLLDKLQGKNLVRRERTDPDQRTVRIYLTGHGERLLSEAPGPPQGTLQEGLSRLPDKYLLDLEMCLEKLVVLLRAKDEEAGMIPISEEQEEFGG
jgi:DNA-binding MarR family transcriptional regulator